MQRMGRSKYLAGQGGDDGLGVDQRGVAQVVEAVRAEDLSAGLEPDGLAEGDAVLGKQLWGHAAQGTEHGPPGVDDLDLAVAAAQAHAESVQGGCHNCRRGETEVDILHDSKERPIEQGIDAPIYVAHKYRMTKWQVCCAQRGLEGRVSSPSEGLGVGGQTGGVPAVVTGELTLQV